MTPVGRAGAAGDRALRTLVARRWALAWLLAGILLPLVVFGQLAEDVWEREGFSWDAPVLRAIHARASPALDAAMVAVTEIAAPVPLAAIAAALLLLLLLRRRFGDALFVAVAVGGAAVLNALAKPFFHRTRPDFWVSLTPERDYGFPSGHAMGSLAICATLIILAWPTRWRWPALIAGIAFTLLVGLSRLYLGVHYPSDILAGWSAALVWVVGVHLIRSLPLPWCRLPGYGRLLVSVPRR